jgi:S1-C subfamily serine protease
VDLYQEATLRPRVRGERGVLGDGDGTHDRSADVGQPRLTRVVRYFGLGKETAVFVVAVEPGSPGQRAGLNEDDLIVGFGELPVRGIDDLLRLLTEDRIGTPVPVTAIRGTERLQLAVTPSESRPE